MQIREPDSEIVQEQEVIAVSHTVAEESFPEKLNKRVPDIKSDKDLSIAVYQNNYLPGLTNGQTKIYLNRQIDMDDRSPDRERFDQNLNLKLVNSTAMSSPDTLSPNRHLDFHCRRRYVLKLFMHSCRVLYNRCQTCWNISCKIPFPVDSAVGRSYG